MKNLIVLWISMTLLSIGSVYGVGDYPVPQITDVTFGAQADYDASTGRFTYQYHIASGTENIGTISTIYLDIKRNYPTFDPAPADFSYSVPKGKEPTAEVMDFFLRYAKLPYRVTIETVATDLPQYWSSNPNRDGDLTISTPSGGGLDENGVERPAYRILPGESYPGLTVIGLSPPTLTEVIISADWYLIVENEAAVTDEIRAQADQIAQDKLIKRFTIGPKRINLTSYDHHNRLIKDIDQMVDLGWINDIVLIDSIRTLLAEAKVFLLDRDGTNAKVKYQQALGLIGATTESQMRREAIDLIRINLVLRLEYVADTVARIEHDMIIDPENAELEIGETG